MDRLLTFYKSFDISTALKTTVLLKVTARTYCQIRVAEQLASIFLIYVTKDAHYFEQSVNLEYVLRLYLLAIPYQFALPRNSNSSIVVSYLDVVNS